MRLLNKQTDQELIRLFIDDNQNAFKILLLRHQKEIYNGIFTLVRDRPVAEDIFQDTFIRIIKSIKNGRYNEKGKFLPWALRVAHNLTLDHLRKCKRIPAFTHQPEVINQFSKYYEESSENKMISTQAAYQLKSVLELLPPEQKQVIFFRHFNDMSFKEIAFAMNTSVNTTMGRMRYALMNLRKMLTQKQFIELCKN